MRRPSRFLVALCAVLTVGGLAGAAGANTIDFNFEDSTPVGSWQEREQIMTDDGGKQTGSVMRISYLGDEERGGEDFVWIEIAMNSFKVQKKGRKPQGDPVYMKILMKKSVLKGDIANALGNFNDTATEVIMQSGDSQPMRLKGAGSLMGGMAQGMGLKVSYTLTREGNESVTVPAGSFECDRYNGEGSSSAKIMFKTMKMESKSTHWISDEVPFGIVKIVSDDVVNGDPQHSETELTKFGLQGAVSKVTGEPQELPAMGNLFGG